MAVTIGPRGTVQRPRFALLREDSDPDEEGWEEVKRSKDHHVKKKPTQSNTTEKIGHPAATRAAVKNAKRRANKRRTLSQSSGGSNDLEEFKAWQSKDELSTEERFEQDLKEALLLSLADTQKDIKEEPQPKAQLQKHLKSKKQAVTLSLQDFLASEEVHPPVAVTHVPLSSQNNSSRGGECTEFFNKLESEVLAELKKEKHKRTPNNPTSTPDPQAAARIAQLKDELEKKDFIINRQLVQQEEIKAEMREVKLRNQVLCKMLSKGEFSTKSELLEQIEELSTDKTELSQEIERLCIELEQERTRNKSLQSEINKLMQNHH